MKSRWLAERPALQCCSRSPPVLHGATILWSGAPDVPEEARLLAFERDNAFPLSSPASGHPLELAGARHWTTCFGYDRSSGQSQRVTGLVLWAIIKRSGLLWSIGNTGAAKCLVSLAKVTTFNQ